MPKRTLDGQAQEFARRYANLVEALVQQGVPVRVARREAREAATLIYLMPEYLDFEEKCPTCGREGE